MITTECLISGDQFFPTRMIGQIPSDARLDLVTEPGQIDARGNYKGIPYPFGYCRIMTPDDVVDSERISWMTNFISRHINNFRENGGTDFVFHIEWTGLQGNMEFTPLELKNIANLQIPLSITYRYEE